MKLPIQKKILKEDLKDAPDWVDVIIGPVNQFMETMYQAMNKNIDEVNLQSMVKEVTLNTPAAYPIMEPIKFQSTLKVRATGCVVLQIIDKSTYKSVSSSNPAWIDNNGVITITELNGLLPSKSYIVRFRVT